jgi:hypothetical protein
MYTQFAKYGAQGLLPRAKLEVLSSPRLEGEAWLFKPRILFFSTRTENLIRGQIYRSPQDYGLAGLHPHWAGV